MKTIGILGGLGPESTCEFYRLITRSYYELYGNYNYPEIIIYSVSFSKFIDCGYKSAGDIRQAIKSLHRAGANFVVAPCNSIHLVYEEVSRDIPIPWISIMDVTAQSITKENISKVGLLGTLFTMSKGFYLEALKKHDIETVIPDMESQQKINDIIFNELVRNIIKKESRQYILKCIDDLHKKEIQGIVLGCTELPFMIRQDDVSLPVFDTTFLYAQKALELALEKNNMIR